MNNDTQNNQSQDDLKKQQEQHNIESNSKAVQTGVKGVATAAGAYLGGSAGAKVGAKVGDAISNSKVGKKIADTGGKMMNDYNKKTPQGRQNQELLNKANDSDATDAINKGIDVAANQGSPSSSVKGGMGGAGGAGNTSNKAIDAAKKGPNISNKAKNGASNSKPIDKQRTLNENKKFSNRPTQNGTQNNFESKENTEENSEQQNSSEEQSPNVLDKAVIAGKNKIIAAGISMLITLATTLLPIALMAIIALLPILIVSSLLNTLFFGEEQNETCFYGTTCKIVILNEGSSAGTYDLDQYIAGVINYEYEDNILTDEAIKAATTVVHSDIIFYSSTNPDEGTCSIIERNKFKNIKIPIDEQLEEYEKYLEGLENTLRDEEIVDIGKYKNILNNGSDVLNKVIIGYNHERENNENEIISPNTFSDYKEIDRKYLGIEDDEEGFNVVNICNFYGGDNINYINSCSTVTIVEGDYMGDYELEDYVAGVINAEVGGFNDLETYKSFAVAARSYLVTRATIENNVCYVANGSNFMAFRPTESVLIKQAVEETTGEYLMNGGSVISTEFDAFCYTNKDSNNYYLAQKNQAIPISWAEANVRTPSYLQNPCGTPGDGGHGRGMSQYGAYYLSTVSHNDYKTILSYYYGASSSVSQGFPISTEGYALPIRGFTLITGETSTGYCRSHNPHSGIDFAASYGTPIYAAHDGTIERVYSYSGNCYPGCGGNQSYGQGYRIKNSDGTISIYAHMAQMVPHSVGDTVRVGEVIGYVGSTGNSSGNHLHYEMHDQNNIVVNPREYIPLDAEGYEVCWNNH